MRVFIWVLVVFLVIPNINAIQFSKDTTFTENNINYVFKEGIEFQDFDISGGGININNDEDRLSLTIQGGELTITFYEYNDGKKTIGIKSSVPQRIDFKIESLGNKQYLYDGTSYYLNTYYADTTEEIKFDYVGFEEKSGDKVDEISSPINQQSWWQEKLVEFEVSSSVSDEGIIRNKTFAITYMWLAIIITGILMVSILWMKLRK